MDKEGKWHEQLLGSILSETHLRGLPACVVLLGFVLPETHLRGLPACIVLLDSILSETPLRGLPACVVLLGSMTPESTSTRPVRLSRAPRLHVTRDHAYAFSPPAPCSSAACYPRPHLRSLPTYVVLLDYTLPETTPARPARLRRAPRSHALRDPDLCSASRLSCAPRPHRPPPPPPQTLGAGAEGDGGGTGAADGGVLRPCATSRGGFLPRPQGAGGAVPGAGGPAIRLREEDRPPQVHRQDSAADAPPPCARQVVPTGKVVAKFCAKYLHTQILKYEPQLGGDLSASVQKAFLRMDEMMKGQRGWRELAVLGDKMDKFTGLIEGLIWSPRGGYSSEHLDEWAYEEGPHSDFSGPTSGSTACVAVIRNNQLIVANAGDSRCVLSRKGRAISLSTDHKPYLVEEKERIVKAGGFIQAGRINGSLNLTRAIGTSSVDMEFKQNKFLPAEKQVVTCNPDINIVELCDDDEFLILACDGVWDCMINQQLVDFITEHIKTESCLSAVCERVLDRCLAPSTISEEGLDNMTMILVQFNKPIRPDAPHT
ncbi:probable protein phosphatase 2C 11 [Musa acuminata AAA Group]|uniref:probable protein phosphatase 2C 11 n=1 Tax=Musa acuminata AAA Group TaxID=214697 RepID=UPI0031E06938